MSLWREMNDVLNRLELMSDVAAPNPSPSGGGKPGSRVLSMTDVPPRDYWLGRWNRATDDRGRERALEGARDELASLTRGARSTTHEETREQTDARILRATHWTPEDIARSGEFFHTSAARVRTLRRASGLDTETGLPDSTTATITRMRSEGMTVRQIAATTGMSKSEIGRRVKKAA